MTAPFKPGDKVVYLPPLDKSSGLAEDLVYTVKDIWYCCKNSGYRLNLVEAECPGKGYVCDSCGTPRGGDGWIARNFRKVDDISDHTTESLLEELSEPVRELQPA